MVEALKELGFEHYVQAEEVGWVLYLEGSTDLAMLRAFAQTLGHSAADHLRMPFVHYVANQPQAAAVGGAAVRRVTVGRGDGSCTAPLLRSARGEARA